MWFISLVFKNVWRRKVRSILTATSMAIAVCAVIAMLGTAEGYEKSLGDLYEARGTDIVVVQSGKVQRIASYLSESLAERLRSVTGVRDVEGALIDIYGLFPEVKMVYLFGVKPDSILMEESKIRAGRRLTKDDKRKLSMGSMLAKNLGKKLGDKVEIYGQDFEIITIYDSFNLLESNGAVIPQRELQEIMGQDRRVTTFLILLEESYKTPAKVEEVRKRIEDLRSPEGHILNIDVQATRDHIKSNSETQMLKGLAWTSSMIAMIIGFVSMLNTMMMSISERIREIATFRAIGWRKWRVMRMIILESLMLAVMGALLGVLTALPLMEFLSNFSATSSTVVNRASLEVIGKGVGMGLIAGFLGALYPAFIAANLAPASALRHE